MIRTAFVLLTVLPVGIPLYAWLRRRVTLQELVGGGFLLGLASSALVLLLLGVLNIAWSRFSVLLILLAAAVLAVAAVRKTKPVILRDRSTLPALGIDLFSLVLIIGFALFATAAPLPEFDFITNWGLKGRLFYEHRGIDWGYLEGAWDRNLHPDYPPLVPLMFSFVSVIGGTWDDRSIGLLFVAIGVAVLLMVRGLMGREIDSPLFVSASTLALVCLTLPPWVGLAEGPLAAYATAGLLLVREATRTMERQAILTGAVFLGCAGLIKNEGVTLIVCVAAAFFFGTRTTPGSYGRIFFMWPAVALACIWQILRSLHHFSTIFSAGDVGGRVSENLQNAVRSIGSAAFAGVGMRYIWIGIAIALLLEPRRTIRMESLILLAMLFQVVFFFAAFAATPFDVAWHIKWSAERLMYQLTLPLTIVALFLIVPRIPSARSAKA